MTQVEIPVPQTNGRRAVLAPHLPRHPSRRTTLVLAALALAGLVIAAIVYARRPPPVGYITAPVVRKDLLAMVTASGTVNPQDTILVGTQVSGTIVELDADFNSAVKTGQVLARIDPTSLQAQLDAAKASELESDSVAAAGAAAAASARHNLTAAARNAAAAGAALAAAESQVGKAGAARDLANLTLRRDAQLLARGFIAQAQADADRSSAIAARAAYAAAAIAVDQARAQLDALIASARAAKAQEQAASASALANRNAIDVQHAAMIQARYNEDHSVILSPVDGTVIQRNISIGQTVAASLQTPTLFMVARNLTKMEVDVAVGEPDIGGVRAGDAAEFTVLAYPNRTFRGTVFAVRQNPTTVNNVVTYDTVVYVQNRNGALLPGMTANVSIHVAKIQRALVVQVAALQWAPPQPRQGRTAAATGSAVSPWGITQASLTRTVVAGRSGRVFVLREGAPTRVPVRVVLVSNTEAAVTPVGAGLAPGAQVVIADTATQLASQQGAAGLALLPANQNRSGGTAR